MPIWQQHLQSPQKSFFAANVDDVNRQCAILPNLFSKQRPNYEMLTQLASALRDAYRYAQGQPLVYHKTLLMVPL